MRSAGTFAKLTKMFIRGVRFTDGGEGISKAVSRRCPCLEVLVLHRVRGVKVLALLAQSPLLFLRVSLVMQLQRLQVGVRKPPRDACAQVLLTDHRSHVDASQCSCAGGAPLGRPLPS